MASEAYKIQQPSKALERVIIIDIGGGIKNGIKGISKRSSKYWSIMKVLSLPSKKKLYRLVFR